MLTEYGYIALFLVLAIAFAVGTAAIPIALRRIKVIPSHPTAVKQDIFECGIPTIGKTWVQFNFRYYFYALVFLTIDVLILFLYPWAVDLRSLGYPGLWAVLILLAIVVIGYLYAWKKKALEWK